MTQLYMDLMEKIVHIRGGMDTAIMYPGMIRRYLFMSQTFRQHHVAAFSDCFFVAKTSVNTKEEQPFPREYDVEAMRLDLRLVSDILSNRCDNEEALTLVAKLTSLLDKGEVPERPVLVKLDKNVVAPYRVLLYDSEQGLVKTEQQQKAFLIELLLTLAESEKKEVLIEKYGHPLLTCSACHRETEQVDPLSMRAFCSEVCVGLFLL
jgi:hypothetical protein